ncbi:MAG: PrsW family intramembrane metalloprotease [Parcubacteria group bacterium]|nr:PrsW family intramembrane metalloprotease [Parcubacteria group bacterium]
MIDVQTFFLALLGGVLPAVLWLSFWLKEDEHPEPKGLIILTFFSGMIAVPLVLPFQKIIYQNFQHSQLITFVLWACFEEVFKFIAAYVIVFKTKEMDEPIDAVIYMLTAALGFVALENAFFLISPLSQGNFIEGIVTGNLRFMGASLLHIISSTTIGIFIALSFYKKRVMKIEYLAIGMILAIILHTIFNLLIIDSTDTITFTIFAVVWIAVIVLLLFFEKIKKIIPNK